MFRKEVKNSNFLVVSLFNEKFSSAEFEELSRYISENSFIKRIGINFNYVKNITNELFEILFKLSKLGDLSVYNMKSENLVPFYLMQYNKIISVFETEDDFIKGHNPVVSRNFVVCR